VASCKGARALGGPSTGGGPLLPLAAARCGGCARSQKSWVDSYLNRTALCPFQGSKLVLSTPLVNY
jgi:hypothetical protein